MLRGKRPCHRGLLILSALLTVNAPALAQTQETTSLRQVVPPDAIMAIVSTRTDEQDVQREHMNDVYQTFMSERIVERAITIIQQRMDEDDFEQAQGGVERFREAVAPASLSELANAEETCFYQVSREQMSQQVAIVRMNAEAVDGYLQAARNLGALLEEVGKEDVGIEEQEVDGTTYLTLLLPENAPMRPTLAAHGDTLVVSSLRELAQDAIAGLKQGRDESKFDDPRVTKVLEKLPAAEDSVMIFDGKMQMESLQQQLEPVLAAMREQADDDEEAATALRMVEAGLREVDVSDLQVTVTYMEEGNVRSETLVTLLPGAEDRLLHEIIEGGAPFERWSRWVPADAVNFKLNSGFSLLQVYQRALDVFSREAPEMAADVMMKLDQYQQQAEFDLKEDLLALFSGETVSVTLPQGQSVTALACNDPDHTREVIGRLIEYAQRFPQVQQQQLELAASETLEGFEDVRANIFAMFGARPVIGFKDGWMIVASTPEAAQSVLDVRWGDAEDITTAADYQRFEQSLNGPVTAISYANTAQNIRQVATFINQAAAMAPLFLGPAMAEAEPKDARTVQQVLGLMPSIARVIESFDFYEATLSYSTPAEPNTVRKSSITLISDE